MIKVLIVVDTMNWCFANRGTALQAYAPPDIKIDIFPYSEQDIGTVPWHKYDVVFCLPTNLVPTLRRLFDTILLDVPIISSHNSGIGRRGAVLFHTLVCSDYTVINNYGAWAEARLDTKPSRFTACNISNGVDLNTFYPKVPIEERPHKVLWTASRDKIEGVEGDIKGYKDVLEPLKMMMSQLNWEFDYMIVDAGAGFNQDQMREWYNTGSYVICASPAEGTPNYMLEGMACGCVPISSKTGNMTEIIQTKRNGVFCKKRQTRFFRDALIQAREGRESMSAAALESIQEWDWSPRCQWFYALFRKIANRECPKAFTYMHTRPCEI